MATKSHQPKIFIGRGNMLWERRIPVNRLHDEVALFLAHTMEALPDVLSTGRALYEFTAHQPPKHAPMQFFLRHALDGLVNKTILSHSSGREVIKECWKRLVGSYSDTRATKAIHEVRNLMAAHVQESRAKELEAQKLRTTVRQFGGPRIFDLLEEAGADLAAQASVLVSHPKFKGNPPRPQRFVKVTLEQLGSLRRILSEANLY